MGPFIRHSTLDPGRGFPGDTIIGKAILPPSGVLRFAPLRSSSEPSLGKCNSAPSWRTEVLHPLSFLTLCLILHQGRVLSPWLNVTTDIAVMSLHPPPPAAHWGKVITGLATGGEARTSCISQVLF